MNIFALNEDAQIAAQDQCDRHVVKMVIEYAQLLSTAHRLLDGKLTTFEKPNGRQQKLYLLWHEKASLDVERGRYVIDKPLCYNATHANRPSAVWARENISNYHWLFQMFQATAQEYTYRYGKTHKTYADIGNFLSHVPHRIRDGRQTPFPQAMPEEYKNEDSIIAYQNYYVGSKSAIAKWTKREVPTWFSDNYKDYDASNFAR